MENGYEYYRYSDPTSIDAVKYIDEVSASLNLEDALIGRLSPRCFRISYRTKELGDICHYDVSLRQSAQHFNVKLNISLSDGTGAGSKRFKDITAESLVSTLSKLFEGIKKSRLTAMSELDQFQKIVTDGLLSAGYTCIGTSPASMAFRGANKNVTVSISELGRFRAVIRYTHKMNGEFPAFETGALVSVDNAEKLLGWVNKL